MSDGRFAWRVIVGRLNGRARLALAQTIERRAGDQLRLRCLRAEAAVAGWPLELSVPGSTPNLLRNARCFRLDETPCQPILRTKSANETSPSDNANSTASNVRAARRAFCRSRWRSVAARSTSAFSFA